MPHDPLPTLMRLRTAELDDARRGLAEALAAEDQAAAVRLTAERAIHHETCLAAASDTDIDVERFARWLTAGRARLRAAERATAEAAAITAAKRAELNLARAAAEATQKTIDKRATIERHRQAVIAQRELDEIGRREEARGAGLVGQNVTGDTR